MVYIIAILGEVNCGKSELIEKFKQKIKRKDQKEENGDELKFHLDGKTCRLILIETNNLDDLRDNVDAIMLCFDPFSINSIDTLIKTYHQIQNKFSLKKNIFLLLLSTKMEGKEKRESFKNLINTNEKLSNLLEKSDQFILETSSHQNKNIIQAFEIVVRKLRIYNQNRIKENAKNTYNNTEKNLNNLEKISKTSHNFKNESNGESKNQNEIKKNNMTQIEKNIYSKYNINYNQLDEKINKVLKETNIQKVKSNEDLNPKRPKKWFNIFKDIN